MISITDELLSKAAYEVDMAILDMLPEPSECSHVFSPLFERKIQKLIQKAKYFTVYKVLRRVACVFIAIVLSAGMFVAFNPNARAAVVDWLREKVDDFYHYFFVGESEPKETVVSTLPTETDETEDTGETEPTVNVVDKKDYYLAWVPDGYKLLTSYEADNGVTFVYVDTTGLIMQFVYMTGSDNQDFLVGGGDYEQKQVAVGPVYADVYLAKLSDHSNAIIWKSEDGNTLFSVTAFVTEDDLIKMAQSLAVKNKS